MCQITPTFEAFKTTHSSYLIVVQVRSLTRLPLGLTVNPPWLDWETPAKWAQRTSKCVRGDEPFSSQDWVEKAWSDRENRSGGKGNSPKLGVSSDAANSWGTHPTPHSFAFDVRLYQRLCMKLLGSLLIWVFVIAFWCLEAAIFLGWVALGFSALQPHTAIVDYVAADPVSPLNDCLIIYAFCWICSSRCVPRLRPDWD